MNEYLFYYNETSADKTNGNGAFIWYSRINEEAIAEAIEQFTKFVADEDKIIQIIIKNKLV